MNKLKFPKDEENICLQCKHRYPIDGFQYMPSGCDYSITYCGCQLGSIRGANVGHRKNCKYFLYDILRDNGRSYD